MSSLASRRIAAVVCVLLWTGTIARAQSAVDGFDPGANAGVFAIAVQPDGRIVVGGAFTTLGGGGTGTQVRNHLGRLTASGALDASFDPGANGDVTTVVVQPDGKILLGGRFTTVGGGGTGTTTRSYLARLNADGSLDAAFNPSANAAVYRLALQPDGKILVGGLFTTLGSGIGLVARNRIARLNTDGSIDAGFNPGANDFVFAIAFQPNGKILVGGAFTTLGGGGTGVATRNHLARLEIDGTLDAGFDPGANDWVFALAVQADGKIVVGGSFSMLGGGGAGTTLRRRIGRLNADGALDGSFDPGANDYLLTVTLQADGRILVGGNFTTLGGGGIGTSSRSYLGRLNPNGTLDASFTSAATSSVVTLSVQPDGKILVGGEFAAVNTPPLGTTPRSGLARLNGDGTLDGIFNPGANAAIVGIAVQPSGKILVGGNFTTLGGGSTGVSARAYLGRLNADGSIDTAFNPSAGNAVYALAGQPDGKILVGGAFAALAGTARNRIGRLNADTSIDAGFNPGANGDVIAMAVQADGKIIVGGSFTTLGGGATGVNVRNYLGRLNADGSLDASFNPGANNSVLTVCVQPDGKILLGGNFTTLGGGGTGTTTRNHLGRLNADGSLDVGFDPGANERVHVIAIDRDGRILAGGDFTMLGGGGSGDSIRNYIARLNADGSLDGGFLAGANQSVYSLAVQTDGKILLGGAFTALSDAPTGTTTRNRLGRFFADGSLDASFDPGANSDVFAVAMQADGKILAGGSFTTLGGGGTGIAARSNIGRLTNTDAAIESLGVTANGATVVWARSGAGPEVWRVTFEASADGASYTPLGAGSRSSGGWQLGGLNLPLGDNLFIRARGFYATGAHGASRSTVESIRRAYSAAPCIYSLSSASASVASGVNAGAVTLSTSDSSCTWTAPNTAFVTVTSNSIGAGTTLITWVTAINPSPSPRTAVVRLAGLPYTITQAGASTTRRVRNDFNHDALSDIAVFRPSLGRWYIIGQTIADWGAPGDVPVPGDYDGDGNPEIAVFRPSNSTWYVGNGLTIVWGLPGDIPVPADYNGDHLTDVAVFRPRTGQWLVRNVGTFGWGLAGDLPVAADYDGDGTTDIAVYRPSTGTWYVRNLSTTVFGLAADIPVPADYDGNGTADIAVFRPASGTWFVMGQYIADWGASGDVPVPMDRSGDGVAELGIFHRATGVWQFKNHVTDTSESVLWGAAGDLPLGGVRAPLATPAGDFDGDRKADLVVFRPSTGDWLTLRSLSGFTDYTVHTFGLSTDTPVARDYDGDGKIDPAVYRPFTGRWFILQSSTNFTVYVSRDWGLDGDTPVPADYDGDGKADIAVFRPSLGRWLVLLSSTGNTSYLSQDFGLNGDIPVPADYDGDGRADIAVFRPSTGQWYVYNRITGTYTLRDWGLSGDLPAAADFDGDGRADLTVYRPSLGRWYIKSTIDGSTITVDWGVAGDAIAPADYDGDGKADVAVYRPSNGDWYVRGQFHRNWGQAGDLPGIKVP